MPAYTVPGEKQFLTKEIIVYLILSVIISWPVALLILAQLPPDFQTGDVDTFTTAVGSLNMLYGLGPMISAIAVTLIYRGRSELKVLFRRVITWKVSFRWYLLALFPVIPQWIGLFVWAQLTGTQLVLPTIGSYLSSWIQISLIATAYYVTEEIGWRGYMLPRLLSMNSWFKSSIIIGVIWGVWHYPLWITSAWATTGSISDVFVMITAFTVYDVGLSVILTLIFKNSRGSVLLAMFLHGSQQANLTKMYTAAGDSALLGSGFIVVQTACLIVIVVLLLLFMRKSIAMQANRPSLE